MSGVKFDFRWAPPAESIVDGFIVQELIPRLEFALENLPYEASEMLAREIRANAPQGTDFKDYRDSINTARVESEEHTYGVVADMVSRRGAAREQGATLLYVRASQDAALSERNIQVRQIRMASLSLYRETGIAPEGLFLLKWSPWPASMLPFPVSKKWGVKLVGRKVRTDEYEAASGKIKEAWRSIVQDAKYAGWDLPPQPSVSSAEVEYVEDFAFYVLRAELGLGEGKPHWRAAIRKVMKTYSGFQKELQEILGNPNYRGWLTPQSPDKMIQPGEAQQIVSLFQSKIAPER